jgi:uncharacterized protein with ACT and thioredoxin-like domain
VSDFKVAAFVMREPLYANWLRILHLAKNQHFNFNQMKKEKSTDE